MKRKRIWTARPPGIDPTHSAPFWNGKTAERIVACRLKEYARINAEKAARKRSKKKNK